MTASGAVLVEISTGSSWVDVTSDVRVADGIEITRGRTGESGQAPPAVCSLTLDDRGGRYSPRNATSDLYGVIGRNTPLRVGKEADATYDAFSQSNGTGDLSFTHTPAGTPTGVVVFLWEVNTTIGATASVTYGGVPMERRLFIGATLGTLKAVGSLYFLGTNIPAGAQTVVVDTTSTLTRHAAVQTVAGGTNCELDNRNWNHSNATPGANPGVNQQTFKRSCLFGSLLSDLDDGSTISPRNSFTESGETDLGTETVNTSRFPTSLNPSVYTFGWNAASAHWAIMTASVRAVNYRFFGEIAEFPGRYELSGKEARVPIEAAGILRRLGRGRDPAAAGLRNFITAGAALFRYWPLAGAVGTQYSRDIAPVWGPNGTDFRFYSEGAGSFKYGESLGSDYLGTGMALFHTDVSPMRGDVASGYAYWALDFVWQSLDLGGLFFTAYDYNGTIWSVNLDGATGIAQVSFVDPLTGPIGFSPTGVLAELLDNQPHHCRLQLAKAGFDTAWSLYVDGALVDSGTQPAYEVYGMSTFKVQYTRTGAESWVTLAHLAVWSDQNSVAWPSAADTYEAFRGYAGEPAGERIERITTLADIPLVTVGTPADTTAMGPQYSEAMLTQISDAEGTDFGILAEPRDQLGLLYRTRTSLYNQDPAATLSYAGGHLAPGLDPVDDDRLTVNDVTATRRDGDSYRIAKTTGALSTAEPPAGVGAYRDETTVNVETDSQLAGVASWLLNLGTLNALRYPAVKVNLAAPDVDAALITALLSVDVGDALDLTGLAAIYTFDDVQLLVVGYTEQIGHVDHVITFVCVPRPPYEVATYATSASVGDTRYDTGGSSLAAPATSSAASLSVATIAGEALWTTDAAAFPLDVAVAGERVTVTNITGASSPQTFTVTRSVNGVVKAQASGADVRLWDTPRYAL